MNYCKIEGKIILNEDFNYTKFKFVLKEIFKKSNMELICCNKIKSMFFVGPGLNCGNFHPFAFLSRGVINFHDGENLKELWYEASFAEGVWSLLLGILFIGTIVAYALKLSYLLIVIPVIFLVFLYAFKDAKKNLNATLQKALEGSVV